MGELSGALESGLAGSRIYELMERVFPFCRSITGQGVRDTLAVIEEVVPGMSTRAVPSGERAFDWTVPQEWNVDEAYIADPSGKRVVDFQDSALHVMSYSTPISEMMDLESLRRHIHTLPDQPDAIPYRTSYYTRDWGFCMSHRALSEMEPGDYQVVMGTRLEDGVLNYGEALIPGRLDDEFLITAHVCHPAQANDNLSGVAIVAELASLLSRVETKYTYRFLWLPGGIGSLVWLSRNVEAIPRIRGGLTLACLGDASPFTYKETFTGLAPVDLAARRVLGAGADYREFEPYGFDERNFTAPAFRIDAGSLTRSPHGGYPEYHSSLDNMEIMSKARLGEAASTVLEILEQLESGTRYVNLFPEGEPQLGRRGLYGAVGGMKKRPEAEMAMLWLLTMSDGRYSDHDVSQRSGISIEILDAAAKDLVSAGLLQTIG